MVSLQSGGPPTPRFSAAELTLYGLLPDSRLATPINPSHHSSFIPATQNESLSDQQSLTDWLPAPDADVQEPAVTVLRGQAGGHTDKRQANREHQKRHRERQKVIRLLKSVWSRFWLLTTRCLYVW